MTAFDRLLVWLASMVLRLIGLRFNQGRGRVWYANIASLRPHRLRSGELAAKRGLVMLGFGAEANLFTMSVTREMMELFRDNAIKTIHLQDTQYAIVEDERR